MKILLLLPDGVGVRNFIYTDFIDKAIIEGHEIIVWAEEDILALIDDRRISKLQIPPVLFTTKLSETKRRAWQTGMLRHWAEKFQDDIYLEYIIRYDSTTLKGRFKNFLVRLQTKYYNSQRRLDRLKSRYISGMISLPYYQKCLQQLEAINPDILLCTHQRALNAVAPLFASRSLRIPNACFIYSWDNLPKATLFLEASNYLVWSEHMKKELITYHPEVKSNQIYVTGTPQFTPYFNNSLKKTRESFASDFNIPIDRNWICYSGDDTRTSPFDQVYLTHLAEAVHDWNHGADRKLHIVFRRCPTDKSNRFDNVLQSYNDIITPVAPIWESINQNAGWDRIVPQKEDIALLINTAFHCDLVINVGSTMAFDFNIFGKPALFINYNACIDCRWDVSTIYKFTHFRSMEDLKPVFWINSKEDIPIKIKEAYSSNSVVDDCAKWLRKIAAHPLEQANKRVLDTLELIAARCTSAS